MYQVCRTWLPIYHISLRLLIGMTKVWLQDFHFLIFSFYKNACLKIVKFFTSVRYRVTLTSPWSPALTHRAEGGSLSSWPLLPGTLLSPYEESLQSCSQDRFQSSVWSSDSGDGVSISRWCTYFQKKILIVMYLVWWASNPELCACYVRLIAELRLEPKPTF